MKKLRKNFERFCFQHRNKGIPNLMLYITIGSAIVYLASMFDESKLLYRILCFDRDLILQGQVWRLLSFIFALPPYRNIFWTAVSLLCYFSLGRAIENIWGTLRFNLFYFTGVILMDAFCMIFPANLVDVSYLNMSLFLAYATLYPNAHFTLFFIIPIKAWIFALIDLGITLYQVIMLTVTGAFPFSLYPLIAIANYFLFFGKDVVNIFPLSWQANVARLFRKKPKAAKKSGTVPFPSAGSYQATTATVKAPYTHRCTVCGKTDVSHPDLEFRYCSRCKGYFCYCEEHINSHNHIE